VSTEQFGLFSSLPSLSPLSLLLALSLAWYLLSFSEKECDKEAQKRETFRSSMREAREEEERAFSLQEREEEKEEWKGSHEMRWSPVSPKMACTLSLLPSCDEWPAIGRMRRQREKRREKTRDSSIVSPDHFGSN
jgi:hypothetical protein